MLLATGSGTARASTARSVLVTALVTAVLVHHSLARVCADDAGDLGPRADSLAMNRARHAIVELDVELGELILIDDAGVLEIAQRTLINDVADSKALDRLILRRFAAAAIAHDQMRVVTPVAVAPVVPPLDGHDEAPVVLATRGV